MRKKVLLGAIALGVVLLVIVAVRNCYILKVPPARDCPIESLLIDESAFPAGTAHAGDILSPLARASWESAGCTFSIPTGIANHDVYRYRAAEGAAREFARRRELEFVTRDAGPDQSIESLGRRSGPWETPEELSDQSPIADQYYVACGMQGRIPMCKMIARYEEYYVFFNVHQYEGEPTYAEIGAVLRAIDERMAQCLDKS